MVCQTASSNVLHHLWWVDFIQPQYTKGFLMHCWCCMKEKMVFVLFCLFCSFWWCNVMQWCNKTYDFSLKEVENQIQITSMVLEKWIIVWTPWYYLKGKDKKKKVIWADGNKNKNKQKHIETETIIALNTWQFFQPSNDLSPPLLHGLPVFTHHQAKKYKSDELTCIGLEKINQQTVKFL